MLKNNNKKINLTLNGNQTSYFENNLFIFNFNSKSDDLSILKKRYVHPMINYSNNQWI